MFHVESLASIPDDELFAGVERLTARSNAALADLLAHLGEVERRRIHRLRACASLYTYCVYELRMSEDAAYRRAKAARLVREYPELHEAIAKGEIHLTGVLMIGPHLGGERHAEILRRARFRSKRELLRLIAEIDPKPEVPALVEPLGPTPAGRATHAVFVESLAGPERQLRPGRRPEDWLQQDSMQEDATSEDEMVRGDDSRRRTAASHARDAEEVRRPLHYRVQFTATQEFVDLLEEIRSLLGHERSGTDLPDVQLRALRALVTELRTKKRAATERPREPLNHRADAAPARKRRGATDAIAAREPDTDTDTTGATAREPHTDTDATDAPARELHGVTDATAAPAPKPHVDTDALARVSQRATDGTDALARVSQRETDGTDALARVSQRAIDARPRAPVRGPEAGGRHIPAPVRRAVFDRDAARCAYHDDRGERCRETRGLELHHRRAHALGGAATLENLELRCRPHNTLAAEQDFGREHMDRMRGVTGGTAPARAF